MRGWVRSPNQIRALNKNHHTKGEKQMTNQAQEAIKHLNDNQESLGEAMQDLDNIHPLTNYILEDSINLLFIDGSYAVFCIEDGVWKEDTFDLEEFLGFDEEEDAKQLREIYFKPTDF